MSSVSNSAEDRSVEDEGEAVGESDPVSTFVTAFRKGQKLEGFFATTALVEAHNPDHVESLIKLLLDRGEHPDVRWHSADVLGKLGDGRAMQPLLAVLEEGRETEHEQDDFGWSLRLITVSALGELRDPRAVDSLLLALDDQDVTIRSYAAQSLGKLGQVAIEPVLVLLKDNAQSLSTRFVAAAALTRLKGSTEEGVEASEIAYLFGPRDCTPEWIGAFLLDDDHNQFWLHDGTSPFDVEYNDSGPLFLEGGYDRPAAFGRRLLCICTHTYGIVPTIIEVHGTAPPLDLAEWDSVVEGNIEVPSGHLALMDSILTPDPQPFTIKLVPGTYRVRAYSNSDPLHFGDPKAGEFWRIALWPDAYSPMKVYVAGGSQSNQVPSMLS